MILRWAFSFLLFFTTLSYASPAFFEAEEAFKPTLELKGDTLHVEIILSPAIYLYKDKVSLTVDNKNITLDFSLPKAEAHEGLDEVEYVYFHKLVFDAKIKNSSAKLQTFKALLSYQGCSEQGLCYQPMELEKSFEVAVTNSSKTKKSVDVVDEEEVEDEYAVIFEGSIIAIIAAFFGFGVLLSLTPCVFPMIPILSSIIVSQGENITTKKAFLLSLVYILAMALAYTIAGVLAGLFGSNLQAALQTPWVIILFSLTFVLLSFSMFGFYELEMPKWLQTRVTKTSHDAEGKGVVGVAIMGFLSALIVGPCVAAPLAGALIYIGESGDAILGGLALFAFSIGMGLPLLAVGVGAGRFMPKPGGWMDAVKAIFGVVMLGIAIWMLDRIVSETATMMLLSVLLIISSAYLGTFDTIDGSTGGWKRFRKGSGIIVFIFGLTLFVGSISNGTFMDPLRAFTSIGVNDKASHKGLVFTESI
ncbi:MAG: protein-disulfide reductase DsbD, partial [Thiovulaceae bacterium]|nr:protein-disulfide reductase DsbD [Sulfurimonadaceae bacterium]